MSHQNGLDNDPENLSMGHTPSIKFNGNEAENYLDTQNDSLVKVQFLESP